MKIAPSQGANVLAAKTAPSHAASVAATPPHADQSDFAAILAAVPEKTSADTKPEEGGRLTADESNRGEASGDSVFTAESAPDSAIPVRQHPSKSAAEVRVSERSDAGTLDERQTTGESTDNILQESEQASPELTFNSSGSGPRVSEKNQDLASQGMAQIPTDSLLPHRKQPAKAHTRAEANTDGMASMWSQKPGDINVLDAIKTASAKKTSFAANPPQNLPTVAEISQGGQTAGRQILLVGHAPATSARTPNDTAATMASAETAQQFALSPLHSNTANNPFHLTSQTETASGNDPRLGAQPTTPVASVATAPNELSSSMMFRSPSHPANFSTVGSTDKPTSASAAAPDVRLEQAPPIAGNLNFANPSSVGHSRQPTLLTSAGLASDPTPQADPSVSLLSLSEVGEKMGWESARPMSGNPAGAAALRSDLVPQVGRQLMEVFTQAGHRPVEIALSPAELGRVRMSVATEDGKITVNILTERPETLDLMRRHIDQLGQTFRSLGYDQISFSFGQGAESGEQTGHRTASQPFDKSAPAPSRDSGPLPEAKVINLNPSQTTGIDIRL